MPATSRDMNPSRTCVNRRRRRRDTAHWLPIAAGQESRTDALHEEWNSSIRQFGGQRRRHNPKVLVILSNYQDAHSQSSHNCCHSKISSHRDTHEIRVEWPALILASPTQFPARGYQINLRKLPCVLEWRAPASGAGSLCPYPQGMITMTMDRVLRYWRILIRWGPDEMGSVSSEVIKID